MKDIKLKDITSKTIKSLDKGVIVTERVKDTVVHTKESLDSNSEEDNIIDYGNDKIKFVTNRATDETIYYFNKYGKKAVVETKNNIIKSKIKMKNIKDKMFSQKRKKTVTKETKNVIKLNKKSEKIAKETAKETKRAVKLARDTAEKTIKNTKKVVKITFKTLKSLLIGTKALLYSFLAVGWLAIVIIILICLIGLLCSSIFGIFFSSEKINNNEMRMNEVVSELNNEMANKILAIQEENTYDEYIINSDRAEWKDILIIYVAKVSKGNNENEVITLDDEKRATLKEIFWTMNNISYEIKEETLDIEQDNNFNQDLKRKTLIINISHKSIDEMINEYHFNFAQKEEIKELLDSKYNNLWSSVIFGTSVGSPNMVEIALSQVGNIGGYPYWSWYGFSNRVDWCAIFVSWVANQAGYIESNVMPKFAVVSTGEHWFKAVGKWKDKGFVPKAGDIIFFDWENDGIPNHVGIVEKVENDKVYTIEGNSNDECKRRSYDLNSNVIYGYGVFN